MRAIIEFFASRHKLAILVTMMIILLGISSLMGIKRDIYPSVDFGMMSISTYYPGASPEDVELNVTNEIEDELKSVEGIDNMTSYSMENVSLILVTLDINEDDQEKIKRDVRDAVSRVTGFPEEVTESPLVKEMSSADEEVIEVGITGDIPYAQLREKARILDKKLNKVSGVSHTKRYGYLDREIQIEVLPQKIDELQLSMNEIIGAIRARNIHGAAGSFESYTSEKDIVTMAQFKDPQQVGEVIVRSSFNGPLTRVKDLAKINDGFEDARLLSRINGVSAISFLVFLSESGDAIRTCSSIRDLLSKENESELGNVNYVYANDTSREVENSFDVVIYNGLIGLILVALILPVFLNFRMAFWVAMGIPVTMLGAIYLLPVLGFYLDTITLTGLVLVIGIVVDDAIIISENIYSRFEKGDTPVQAAVNGVSEVIAPVVTTVLTTFLVFAPMFFMPGIFGKFIFVIPLAISLALFVSLSESIVSLPAHLANGLKRGAKDAKRAWFNPIREAFRKSLYPLLRLRYVTVLLAIAMLIGALSIAGSSIKFILFPSDMAQVFIVQAELPTGTSLLHTSEKFKEIEDVIMGLPKTELASFNSRIGTNVQLNAESENYAAMRVYLTPYSDRDRTADVIVEELRAKTDSLEGFANIGFMIVSGGPPVGEAVSLRIVGSDDEMRSQLADSIVTFLGGIEGVKDISRDDKGGKDQVEIVLDHDQLARVGLTVADVAQTVRIAYDGEIVTSVRYGEEDVDFRVIMTPSARTSEDYLNQLRVPNDKGRMIQLSSVASLSAGPGNSDFRHYDGERTITVEADLLQDVTTSLEVTEKVFAHFNVVSDWPGMDLTLGGEAIETEESMDGLFRVMIIAIVAVYFLLVLLFNSFSQPFIVMVAIPFGMIGVIAAFWLHQEPFSFVAMMGIIGLSGVVVNDSLVLVSHINRLKKEQKDYDIRTLVAGATSDRLRAIVMTTVTTVLALLPLAYGLGGTSPFMAPMALALGWGLLFATPLTLVLVPSLYVIGDDIGKLFKRK